MPGKNVQFVLIDDNPVDLLFHEQLIRNHGIGDRILSFKEAKVALDYFRGFRDAPDRYDMTVILLDLQMPELNGFEFLKYVEEMPPFILDKTWVIIVSSSIGDADRERFDGYAFVRGAFRKPVDAEQLKGLLNDVE